MLDPDAPDAPAGTHAKPFPVVIVCKVWHPAEVAYFVVALPGCYRAPRVVRLRGSVHRRPGSHAGRVVEQVPYEDLAVVGARRQRSPPQGGPFDAVDGAAVAP